MVDAVWNETAQQPSVELSPQPQTTITPQYLQISYGNAGSTNRRESLLSPSANRRTKVQRGIAGEFVYTKHFYCKYFPLPDFIPTAPDLYSTCTVYTHYAHTKLSGHRISITINCIWANGKRIASFVLQSLLSC